MLTLKNSLTICILLIFLLSSQLYAGTTLAVMDFHNKGVSKSLAQNISELIRTEIINCGKYTVLERSRMKDILKVHNFNMTGMTNANKAAEIGKLLSTQKILIGSVIKLGSKIIINGRVIDVEKGIAEFAGKESAASLEEIDIAVTAFASHLTGSNPQLSQSPKSANGIVLTLNKRVYSPKERIEVTYVNFPDTNKFECIAITKSSNPDTTIFKRGEYFWTKRKSGKLNFKFRKGLEPGTYEARAYLKWHKSEKLRNYEVGSRTRFTVK